MSTAVIYNGFGKYETGEKGEKGITLKHGGVPFWLPFQKVSYIPDYTMREVDHNASSADDQTEAVLTYKTFRLSGQRIAEELLETQLPVKNSEKGIILVSQSDRKKFKDSHIGVLAGYSEDGQALFAEVQEIVPTQAEKDEAENLARKYKERLIQEYFQSKRERMAGGNGRIFPTGLVATFMEELGVKDIDDVSRQTNTAGLEALIALLQKPAVPDPVVAPVVVPVAPKPLVAADLV